ncbi:MAG: TetR family transcriptional regulator [Acidobacteriota bacterium]|nr:TetR family transcriptional regulator [Acidobacteriota bacterium]
MPRPSRWDDVVAAAAKVFRARGFAAASLDEIAGNLGMSKGSLYNYVSSKEELLEAVVGPPAEELLGTLRVLAAMDLPASEKVRRVTRIHVSVLERTYDFAAVYLHEVAGRGLGEEWAAKDHEYVCLIEDVIASGVAEGLFAPDTDVLVSAMALIGALNWLTRWWHVEGAISASTIAERISDVFLAGLLVRSAAKEPPAPSG